MSDSLNAAKRIARITFLSGVLQSKATINTVASRHLCIRIARELVDLLKAEDAYQTTMSVPVPVHSTPAHRP